EVKSWDIPTVKRALSRKINAATHTLVIVGKSANRRHLDYAEIGFKNWINYEVSKSKEARNKLVGIKIDRSYDSPDELLNASASWAYAFTEASILDALAK